MKLKKTSLTKELTSAYFKSSLMLFLAFLVTSNLFIIFYSNIQDRNLSSIFNDFIKTNLTKTLTNPNENSFRQALSFQQNIKKDKLFKQTQEELKKQSFSNLEAENFLFNSPININNTNYLVLYQKNKNILYYLNLTSLLKDLEIALENSFNTPRKIYLVNKNSQIYSKNNSFSTTKKINFENKFLNLKKESFSLKSLDQNWFIATEILNFKKITIIKLNLTLVLIFLVFLVFFNSNLKEIILQTKLKLKEESLEDFANLQGQTTSKEKIKILKRIAQNYLNNFEDKKETFFKNSNQASSILIQHKNKLKETEKSLINIIKDTKNFLENDIKTRAITKNILIEIENSSSLKKITKFDPQIIENLTLNNKANQENIYSFTREINSQVKKIKNTFDTISKIADQVNLLSINVNLQAKKENLTKGKGFEIVAQEIQNLCFSLNEKTQSLGFEFESLTNFSNKLFKTLEVSNKEFAESFDLLNYAKKIAPLAQTMHELQTKIYSTLKGQENFFMQFSNHIEINSKAIESNKNNTENELENLISNLEKNRIIFNEIEKLVKESLNNIDIL